MENKIKGDVDKIIDHIVERHELLRKHNSIYKNASEVDLTRLRTLYKQLLPYRYNSECVNGKWLQDWILSNSNILFDKYVVKLDRILNDLILDNILLGSLYLTFEDVTRPKLTYEEMIENSDRIKRLIEQGILKEVRSESYEIEFQ